MTNHYHVVVETTDSSLAQGMRHLTGVYTRQEIATHFGVHYSTLSRAARWLEMLEQYRT